MEKVIVWMIILGAVYGFVLLACNLVYAGIRLWDFLKDRKCHDGRKDDSHA